MSRYLCVIFRCRHSWLGNKAVQQLESALSALERTCDTWTRRAALSCVDIESLCSEHLKEPADWEANFKACKAYGQAVAKMTFEDEKIEWITVGTVSLRREFEAQTRNLWACLMTSLQNSCRADALEVDAFIASASVMLENKSLPKNAKDLAEISAKQQTLQKNMPEMEKTVENLKRKSHMLRTWGGDSTTEGVIKEWQKIRDMMLGQQQMFEHQADIVKSTLSGEWDNLNSSVEAWASRWSQNKGRLEETHGVLFPEMADRCRSVFDAQAQWEKFVVDRDELVKECVKFNLDLQPSDVWTEAEKLMDEYTNIWTPLKNYNEGKNLMTFPWRIRKHEGIERDLAALEDKVSTIDGEAARLAAIHADHAPAIHAKRDEISAAWQNLVQKAKERRSELESSYALHRFLADYRDLASWMSDIRALIAADDLAKDVPGAEALLERHQEHK
ncbi:hypothetical protein evm_015166, partial [Chilo suppressalis]